MKSKAHGNTQLSLGPMPLRDSEPADPAFRTSEHPEQSEQLAAQLLNDAFTAARLTNKEIAHLCGVSVSLVEKWRSAESRGAPSFVQMLRLPPSFHWELNKAMDRRFGYGRAALVQVLEGLGVLALAVEPK